MSYTLKEMVDFGTVMTTEYFYLNMAQGPDFYKFKLPVDQAKPFVELNDKAEKLLAPAFKEIDPESYEITQGCYEPDTKEEGYVEFCAFILGPVWINGKEYDESGAINTMDEIEADTVQVKCSLVCGDEVFDTNGLLLELKAVDFDNGQKK